MTTVKFGDVVTFKHADVLRVTGATVNQLKYWLQLGLITPLKDATSSGDHRQFSMLNVIQVSMACWLAFLGMTPARMQQVFAAQRSTMARVPPSTQAVQAWLQYVHMVRAGATLVGLADTPAYTRWAREVAIVMRRLEKKPVAPDAQLLDLLAAQRAALSHTQERGDATR